VTCRFAYTLRTIKEQNDLYALGRTKLFDANGKRLGIVTNAKGGQSYHNYGLAFDIVLLTKNGASWDIITDFDGDGISDWKEIVNIFKKHGYVWGGDWKFKDAPHFEKSFGHSVANLQTLHSGNKFIPGTQYVQI
jgi:peptidoglycan L-alanyl-D-glutamate endopeptidase CwlK